MQTNTVGDRQNNSAEHLANQLTSKHCPQGCFQCRAKRSTRQLALKKKNNSKLSVLPTAFSTYFICRLLLFFYTKTKHCTFPGSSSSSSRLPRRVNSASLSQYFLAKNSCSDVPIILSAGIMSFGPVQLYLFTFIVCGCILNFMGRRK